MVSLEHFYYGQLVHHGTPKGDNRILARSKGLTEDIANTALMISNMMPLDDSPRTAWQLIRGGSREIPFLLVHVQRGIADIITRHFIVIPTDVPRGLMGNFKAYLDLIPEQLPTFDMITDLKPIVFNMPSPISVAAQAEALLDLMTYTRNNTKHIEPPLSAIINGRTLIVRNAPVDVESRLGFLQGLITLLPPSTRFSITFALHATPNELPNAQIIFVEGVANDPKQSSYDWKTGKTDNDIPNDYSRFITSQLRLDAEIAVRQAESLTQTAGWRFKSGDTLANALTYASHRSTIDRSIENNLPVEAKDVSQILDTDPTLDDRQRIAYANHLIKFAMALDDTTYTDPVAITCAKYPELGKIVFHEFENAVRQGKASLIFQTLARWMQNPLSPQSPEWLDLLQKSALIELREIVAAHDAEVLSDYLGDLQHLESANMVNRIVPKVIELSIPLARENVQIPSQLLLLGITYLDKNTFQKLLAIPDLTQYLPREVKRFLAALNASSTPPAKGIIIEAAAQLGEPNKDEATMQFVEMAHASTKIGLIDTEVLAEMTRIAVSPRGGKFLGTVLNVTRQISDDFVEKLPEPAPRYVLQLFLASRRYDLLAKAMVEQSKNIYGGERQQEYVKMIQEMFANTPLGDEDLRKAITALRDMYIKDVPLICAMIGAVQASNNSLELDDFAHDATKALLTNPRYKEVIHPEAPHALIEYYIKHSRDIEIRRLATLLPDVAATRDDRESLMAIRESYRLLNAHDAYRNMAFETLRHYVRIANEKPAQRILDFYSKELGNPYAEKLQRAYEFSVFTNRLTLQAYATSVHLTANLLQNSYEAFFKSKPIVQEFDAVLENIRVRVDKARQVEIGRELMRLIKVVLALGKQMDARHLSYEAISAVVKGTENPRTVLEIFRSGGGHLLKGKLYQIKLKQNDHPFLFGDVLAVDLLAQLVIANDTLRQPLQLFPNKVSWTVQNIKDELDSLLSMTYDGDRELLVELGTDWQRLAEIIPLIVRDADPALGDENSRSMKIFDDQKVLPKSALEFWRYVQGYFQN